MFLIKFHFSLKETNLTINLIEYFYDVSHGIIYNSEIMYLSCNSLRNSIIKSHFPHLHGFIPAIILFEMLNSTVFMISYVYFNQTVFTICKLRLKYECSDWNIKGRKTLTCHFDSTIFVTIRLKYITTREWVSE